MTSPQGPRVHLPVTYFLFRDTTSLLVRTLSASLRPKYETPYLFTSANSNAWFSSETLALYKSHTYLLTYFYMWFETPKWTYTHWRSSCLSAFWFVCWLQIMLLCCFFGTAFEQETVEMIRNGVIWTCCMRENIKMYPRRVSSNY